MLKIRLSKRGRKKAPSYRIVVSEATAPRDGKHIEIIGFFNPSHNPVLFEYDKEKYGKWIKNGAQPTKAVIELIEGKYEFKPYTKETRQKAEEQAAEQNEQEAQVEEKVEQNEEAPAEEKKE